MTKVRISNEKFEVLEKNHKSKKNWNNRKIGLNFLVQVYKIPCFLKPTNGKKLINNPLNFD